MEFEALEDDVNIIHGDLWEQLNAGGQVRFVVTVVTIVAFLVLFIRFYQ